MRSARRGPAGRFAFPGNGAGAGVRCGLEFFETPQQSVVAMQGYTFGGALELCLRCDIRIGATDLMVAMPEILFGLIPDTGGTQLLTAVVGPGRAKELVMTGGRLDAR